MSKFWREKIIEKEEQTIQQVVKLEFFKEDRLRNLNLDTYSELSQISSFLPVILRGIGPIMT